MPRNKEDSPPHVGVQCSFWASSGKETTRPRWREPVEREAEMSDDKKPKKDLRARLGKTIAPNTPGAVMPPGLDLPGMAPVAAPPVAAPVGAPAIAPPPVAAPPIAPPIAAPPMGGLFGNDIAPPPFAQAAAAQAAAAAAAPKAPPPPSDPFAASPYTGGPNEVRLVFDDKAVADVEVGRAQKGRAAMIGGFALMLGAALGAGGGSMNSQRTLYNTTVRDGHAIQAAVATSATTVLNAQQRVDALVAAAAGQGGQPPHVDYDAIEAIRAMEVPFSAQDFSGKNYQAFSEASNDLFVYANQVTQLWSLFGHLQATTLPEARRAELDRTATALGEAATQQYGAVLVRAPEDQGGQILGQLAFVEPVTDAAGAQTAQVRARATRGGPGREMAVFAPEVEIGENPTHVLIIDVQGSRGVLATQTGAFGDYINDIREIKTLIDTTVEVQGRLTTALGTVAGLQEVFAIGG